MARLRTEAMSSLSWGSTPSLVMGAGRRAIGVCEVVNPTDRDIFIRQVPMWSDQLRDRNGAPLRKVSLMRTVPAGSTVSLPMRLKLHPQTPPGEYTVAVMLGNERREMQVQVPERQQLRLATTRLSLVGEPRARVVQPLEIANRGNVPLQIGRLGSVILEESGGLCRSVQTSLRSSGDQGYQPFLDKLVAEFAQTRVDMLRVRLLEAVDAIAPGETRTLPLEFHFPPDLKPGRRYFGRLDLRNHTVQIQLTAQGRTTDSPGEGL